MAFWFASRVFAKSYGPIKARQQCSSFQQALPARVPASVLAVYGPRRLYDGLVQTFLYGYKERPADAIQHVKYACSRREQFQNIAVRKRFSITKCFECSSFFISDIYSQRIQYCTDNFLASAQLHKSICSHELSSVLPDENVSGMASLIRLSYYLAGHLPPQLSSSISIYGRELHNTIRPYVIHSSSFVKPHIIAARAWVNECARVLDPATIILITVAVCYFFYFAFQIGRHVLRPFKEYGILPVLFRVLRSFPPVATVIAKEKNKMRDEILAKRAVQGNDRMTQLPPTGKPANQVLMLLKQRASSDVQVSTVCSSVVNPQ